MAVEKELSPWEHCVRSSWTSLKTMREYSKAVQAIEDDPRISAKLGLAGTAFSSYNVSAETVLGRVLHEAAARCIASAHIAEAFDEAFDALLTDIERPSLTLEVLVPLVTMSAERAHIDLLEGTTLTTLDSEAIGLAVSMGAVLPWPSPRGRRSIAPVIALRVVIDVPTRFGPSNAVTNLEDAERLVRPIRETVTAVIQCLRLLKADEFHAPMMLISSAGVLGGRACTAEGLSSERPFQLAPSYHLKAADEPELTELLRHLLDPQRRKWIALPVRRFGFAAKRTTEEDRIVDLMIAAEALFLNDVGEAGRGELRYRLSLRASLFIKCGYPRRKVFEFFKRAYDLRSAVVHGGIPSQKQLRSPGGDSITMAQFAEILQTLLRAALQRAAGVGVAPKWDDDLFTALVRSDQALSSPVDD
ncbi:MAG TPA: hypothetical protein VGG39_10590 [Polyangiaceae bacterium]|jgi:hypothetical protein